MCSLHFKNLKHQRPRCINKAPFQNGCNTWISTHMFVSEQGKATVCQGSKGTIGIAWLPGPLPTLPMARDPISAPWGHYFQRCHTKLVFCSTTVLPCLAIAPTELDWPTGWHPGPLLACPILQGCAQCLELELSPGTPQLPPSCPAPWLGSWDEPALLTSWGSSMTPVPQGATTRTVPWCYVAVLLPKKKTNKQKVAFNYH